MSNLELNHVYKMYPNGVKAVNDFSMDIKDKEFIVFVGPSGCGKSTTLRMIAGLEDITSGEIKIDGLVVNDAEPKERDIAMVFQNYALYPHMTVYNNMAFGLKLRHMPRAEIDRRVHEAAEILGITDYLDRKPKAMSGGQRQRVALGRAIVREPKVFLLDEPLSNLDAKLRAQMRSEISKLHDKLQTTFIYVTHDQVEAMTMGTRIVVMRDGFVQQIDTPQNLYRYPENKFVAGFIGTPQMNFLKCHLKASGDEVSITLDDVDLSFVTPLELFSKVDVSYLTGEKEIFLGLRSEHISTDPNKYPVKARARVSHVEDLGVDSQVYADLNIENDEIVNESNTRIIVRGPTGINLHTNDVVEFSFDLAHMHLFDAETEETISPRLPKTINANAEIRDGKLSLFGNEVNLPKELLIEEGNYSVSIPTDAIKRGKTFETKVIKTERTTDKVIYSLKAENQYLFFAEDLIQNKVDEENVISVDIDLKRIRFVSSSTSKEPLRLVNTLDGTVINCSSSVDHVAENGKQKKIKMNYCIIKVMGVDFMTGSELGLKLINLKENKIFKDVVELQFTPYDVELSSEGIECQVKEILDYGEEKFAVCALNDGNEIIVSIDESVECGSNHLGIKIDKIHAYNKKNKIRLV